MIFAHLTLVSARDFGVDEHENCTTCTRFFNLIQDSLVDERFAGMLREMFRPMCDAMEKPFNNVCNLAFEYVGGKLYSELGRQLKEFDYCSFFDLCSGDDNPIVAKTITKLPSANESCYFCNDFMGSLTQQLQDPGLPYVFKDAFSMVCSTYLGDTVCDMFYETLVPALLPAFGKRIEELDVCHTWDVCE